MQQCNLQREGPCRKERACCGRDHARDVKGLTARMHLQSSVLHCPTLNDEMIRDSAALPNNCVTLCNTMMLNYQRGAPLWCDVQSERVVPHGLHHTVARHTGEVQRVFHQSIYTGTILHLLVMEGSFGFVLKPEVSANLYLLIFFHMLYMSNHEYYMSITCSKKRCKQELHAVDIVDGVDVNWTRSRAPNVYHVLRGSGTFQSHHLGTLDTSRIQSLDTSGRHASVLPSSPWLLASTLHLIFWWLSNMRNQCEICIPSLSCLSQLAPSRSLENEWKTPLSSRFHRCLAYCTACTEPGLLQITEWGGNMTATSARTAQRLHL